MGAGRVCGGRQDEVDVWGERCRQPGEVCSVLLGESIYPVQHKDYGAVRPHLTKKGVELIHQMRETLG